MGTKPQDQIIRDSFALLASRVDTLIDRFYERLFARAPQVRPLFPTDLSKQKSHLKAAVGLVVKNASDLRSIEGPLMEMGARHVGYGAQPAHYEVVRQEMIGAMKELAGDLWNNDIERAWTGALDAVSLVMIRGGERSSRRAA